MTGNSPLNNKRRTVDRLQWTTDGDGSVRVRVFDINEEDVLLRKNGRVFIIVDCELPIAHRDFRTTDLGPVDEPYDLATE